MLVDRQDSKQLNLKMDCLIMAVDLIKTGYVSGDPKAIIKTAETFYKFITE